MGHIIFFLGSGSQNSIFSLDVDDTATLFCHGTEKRSNLIDMDSLGLVVSPLDNNKVELLCNPNKEFEVDGKVVSVDRLNDATCTLIMEPLIEVKIDILYKTFQCKYSYNTSIWPYFFVK